MKNHLYLPYGSLKKNKMLITLDAKSTEFLICTIYNSVPNDHFSVSCSQYSVSRVKFVIPLTGGKIPYASLRVR